MKLYFDTCCYNRPQDDQSQVRIRRESEAVMNIRKQAKQYGFAVLGSVTLEKEIGRISDAKKLANVLALYRETVTEPATYKKDVFESLSKQARRAGVRGFDVFHLCYSASSEAAYLLTVDDRFLAAASGLGISVKVINPVNFPFGGAV